MNIDRHFVGFVAGQIMGAQLATRANPLTAGDDHLDRLADLSVRGALAVDAAIARAEAREEEPAVDAAATDESADIPEDWGELHHNSRIAMARRIAPDAQIDTAEAADAVIRAEVDRRATPAEPVAQA